MNLLKIITLLLLIINITLAYKLFFSELNYTGVKTEYHYDNDIQSKTPYINGKKMGLSVEYHKNGAIKCETPYIDDKIHGIVRYYYPSEDLEAEIPYNTGLIDGKLKEYYESGFLREEIDFVNNQPVQIRNYDEKGFFISEEIIVE